MKKMMEEEEQESSVCKLNYTNYDGFSDGLRHSWKNALTAQTRLCYFSGLLCYCFDSEHTSAVLHFAVKSYI